MSEYVPTTEDVREAFVVGVDPEVTARYRAEFDRWLAALIREAKAEALEEVAEEFRVNVWLEVLKPAGGMPGLIRNANSVGEYLLAHAAEYREGSEA